MAKPARRNWRRLTLELLVMLTVVYGVFAWKARNLLADETLAPPAYLTTLDGQPVQLADFKGKRITLHFWATWCTVCAFEHGTLNAVHAGLDDDEVLLSVVADGDDVAKVRQAIAEHDIRYPVLLTNRATLNAFKVTQYPTNYYLDAQGRLTDGDVGVSSRWGMRWRLNCAGD